MKSIIVETKTLMTDTFRQKSVDSEISELLNETEIDEEEDILYPVDFIFDMSDVLAINKYDDDSTIRFSTGDAFIIKMSFQELKELFKKSRE